MNIVLFGFYRVLHVRGVLYNGGVSIRRVTSFLRSFYVLRSIGLCPISNVQPSREEGLFSKDSLVVFRGFYIMYARVRIDQHVTNSHVVRLFT